MKRYIVNCLEYAYYEFVTKSQFLNFIFVIYLFQFIDINFIDFFETIKFENIYILNVIYYIFKFLIFFIRNFANIENVI